MSQVGLPLMGDTAVHTAVWARVITAFELNFYQIIIIIIIIINFMFTQDTHITAVFFSGVLQL